MMMTKKEKKRVPELRFVGFEEEWEEKTLEEISRNVAYGMNAAATTFDGENQYLRITDIDEDSRTFLPSPLSSPEGEINEKFILKKGDIVFARTGASVGKSYLYNENDGKLLFAGFLIRFNIHKANPYFVFQHTFLEAYNKWVLVYSMRSGQPGLNAEEYKQLAINLPQLEEQQKIALFLTSTDTRIQQLEKKRTLLEQYKKGVMQRIFKQEVRFKRDDGEEFGEWEKKKLKQVTDIVKGKQLNREELTETGKYACQNGGINPSGYTDKFNTPENTITISEGGNSCGYVNLMTSKFWCGGHCYSLVNLKKVIINEYLFQYLKYNQRRIMRLRVGSGLPNIQRRDIINFKIRIPCLAEQTKIAHFLTSLDKKIAVMEQQIAGAKEWKKGVLQKLFI